MSVHSSRRSRTSGSSASAEDGITPAVSATIAAIGLEILGDDAALDWCYHGGPLPD